MVLCPPLDPMPPIPIGGSHPGAFGAKRRHDIHTGVDLYTPHGLPVRAIMFGEVVDVQTFTGASIGMDWWNETQVIYVKNFDDIIAYGEVESHVKRGDKVEYGQIIGHVLTVLKEYRGRPMSMLHVERYYGWTAKKIHETSKPLQNGKKIFWDLWKTEDKKPYGLRDPTNLLLSIPGTVPQWHDPYK